MQNTVSRTPLTSTKTAKLRPIENINIRVRKNLTIIKRKTEQSNFHKNKKSTKLQCK